MADKFGHIKENRQDKVRNWTPHGSPAVASAGGVDGFVIQEFDCHISLSGRVRYTKKVKLNIVLFEREFLILAADFYVKKIKTAIFQSGENKISPQIAKRRILQSAKWIESNHLYGDCSNFPLYSELNFKINFGHVFMGYPLLRSLIGLPTTFSQQIFLNK
jgi:hypothetical protein